MAFATPVVDQWLDSLMLHLKACEDQMFQMLSYVQK